MIITLIGLALALLISLFLEFTTFELNVRITAQLIGMIGVITILVAVWVKSTEFFPLQKGALKFFTRLPSLSQKESLVSRSGVFLFLFPLISFFVAIGLPIISEEAHVLLVFSVWIFLFSFFLDLIRDSLKQSQRYLDPYYLVEILHVEGKNAIQDNQNHRFYNTLDDLSELTIHAVDKEQISLAMDGMNAFTTLLHTFFAASKSITHINKDAEVEKETGLDEASFTLFYLLERMEMIFNKLLRTSDELLIFHLMRVMGKILLNCAQLDLTLLVFPARVIGKFSRKAIDKGFEEVPSMGIATFLEVSKEILTHFDLTYAELEEPFYVVISELESIVKKSFKKDKTQKISVLVEPFKELKLLFETEKMAMHRDTPAIILRINSVLEEFAMVEQVLKTVPPMELNEK